MFSNLNKSQQLAVQHIDGPMLILAGAGSGKTKTITTRLAYLISLGIDPSSILTLTFTNKAAKEMKHRALSLIDNISYPPLLCTFHKFGLLFLKFHIEKLGRKNNFVIIDTDDKKKILKNFVKNINTPTLASEISNLKNSLVSIDDAKTFANDKYSLEVAYVYRKYQDYITENNLVDFDDLLFLTYKILNENDELAKETSSKYQYLMVDEYQDTNELQYKLLKKLAQEHNNICVVGDDDQSIYGWRGASIKNILTFTDSFKGVKTIKLEENYRSTKKILFHANALIEHNRDRLGKKLISTKDDGADLKLYESRDENDETKKIVNDISLLVNKGEQLNDIAILFRVNALSRALEEGLNKARINYKLVGGLRFYERAEVKDLIAYFRVITNSNDDFSIKRIINKPRRGIGKTTLEKLELESNKQCKTIFDFMKDSSSEDLLELVGKRNARTIKVFIASIEDMQDVLKVSKLDFTKQFEECFDFKSTYAKTIDYIDRVANIDEFYGYLRDFFINNKDLGLKDFLNEIALESAADQIDDKYISLMSVHASKGLEFKHIFIIGMEEGFFPLIGDGSDIEEERRLGYVAITRAKENLTMSCVRSRFYKGFRSQLERSRFLVESELIKGSLSINKKSEYEKNDIVKHKLFGIGKVDSISKTGKDLKLKINFGGITKEILSSFVQKV